jgi:hypothetical protein
MDPNYQPPQPPIPQPEPTPPPAPVAAPAPIPAAPSPPSAPPPPPVAFDPAKQEAIYKHNPLSVIEDGEQTVCEIKRHPFGLVGMYASMCAGLIACAVAIVLVSHYVPNISSRLQMLLWLLFLIVAAFTALFAYISTTIYKNNRWIVTTDSITQVAQVGLFRKQVSQLSLANLEDVTAEQNNLIQSMFKFGTLRAETAGERSKFQFPYCPDPNAYARQILQARENFIRNDPEGAKRANDLLSVPRPQSQ